MISLRCFHLRLYFYLFTREKAGTRHITWACRSCRLGSACSHNIAAAGQTHIVLEHILLLEQLHENPDADNKDQNSIAREPLGFVFFERWLGRGRVFRLNTGWWSPKLLVISS